METNRSMIDGWTVGHVLWGVALGLLGTPRPVVWIGAIAFEAIERPAFSTRPETARNQVADAAATIAGYEISKK